MTEDEIVRQLVDGWQKLDRQRANHERVLADLRAKSQRFTRALILFGISAFTVEVAVIAAMAYRARQLFALGECLVFLAMAPFLVWAFRK